MISLIVAFDQHQLIGKDNQMPWHFPADLKYFKEQTFGKPIVMGRKTFESILSYGGPLKGRHHYVLTRDLTYQYDHPDVTIVHQLDSLFKTDEEWFVIGGANLYQQCLPLADTLYITHIDQTYEGDTYFPPIPWEDFEGQLVKREGPLRFCLYTRKKNIR